MLTSNWQKATNSWSKELIEAISENSYSYDFTNITMNQANELEKNIQILNKSQNITGDETLIPEGSEIKVFMEKDFTRIQVTYKESGHTSMTNVMIGKDKSVNYNKHIVGSPVDWDVQMPENLQQQFFNELNNKIQQLRRVLWW